MVELRKSLVSPQSFQLLKRIRGPNHWVVPDLFLIDLLHQSFLPLPHPVSLLEKHLAAFHCPSEWRGLILTRLTSFWRSQRIVWHAANRWLPKSSNVARLCTHQTLPFRVFTEIRGLLDTWLPVYILDCGRWLLLFLHLVGLLSFQQRRVLLGFDVWYELGPHVQFVSRQPKTFYIFSRLSC